MRYRRWAGVLSILLALVLAGFLVGSAFDLRPALQAVVAATSHIYDLAITQDLEVGRALTVTGVSKFTGAQTFTGAPTFNAAATFNGTESHTGNTTFTGANTMYYLTVRRLTVAADSTYTIVADEVITPSMYYSVMNVNCAAPLSFTVGITNVVTGRLMTIVNRSTNVCWLGVSSGTLPSYNVIAGNVMPLTMYSAIELYFDGTRWIEFSRSIK